MRGTICVNTEILYQVRALDNRKISQKGGNKIYSSGETEPDGRRRIKWGKGVNRK